MAVKAAVQFVHKELQNQVIAIAPKISPPKVESVDLSSVVVVPEWAQPLLVPSRYKAAHGGRSGGKSHFFAERLVKRFVENPNLRILCVREIQKSLKYSAKSLIEDKIAAFGVGHFVEKLIGEIRSTQGSGFIIFQGMQDHTADSVKGLEGIDIVWVEEAQNLSKRSLDLLLPTIRKPKSELWFSWNPDQPENPVDAFFRGESGAPKGAIVVEVNYTDNPLISQESIALAETARRQDMQAYLHIWMGHYNVKSDAQILNGKWVVDEFEPQENWGGPYHGADWGFATDPTAAVRLWTGGRKLYVEYESYTYHLELDDTSKQWIKDIPEIDRYVVRVDSARPDSISHVRRGRTGENGIPPIPKLTGAQKGANSIEDGIAHLRSYEQIIIHPRCKHFAEEARLYSYKVDRDTGDVLPQIIDKHNHLIDSARYALEPLIKSSVKPVRQFQPATYRNWGS